MVKALDSVLRTIVAATFMFFVGITFLQVVLRYGFANSLPWIDELSRYAFIWLVFIAGALVARQGAHTAIDLIDEIAPPAWQRPLAVLADASMVAFGAVLGLGGWHLMQINWTTRSPASGIPIAWVQSVLPLAGLLIALFAGAHLIDVLRRAEAAND